MARAFHHDLDVVRPGPLGQLTQTHQLFDLADVGGVGEAAGAAGIAREMVTSCSSQMSRISSKCS